MTCRARLLLLTCLLALGPALACDVEDDGEIHASLDGEALPEHFACGDLTAVAAAPDGSEALLLGIEDGLAAAARESGEPVTAHYELPDPRLTVRWVSGSNVLQGQCGRDNGDAWQLDERLDAMKGRIEVIVAPRYDENADGNGKGELELHAVLEHVEFDHDMQLWAQTIDARIE